MSRSPAPAAPPMPRWLHPSVRVRVRSGVVCVEQRVPARVAEFKVVHDMDRTGPDKRTVPFYESGLTDPDALPLVRERLTVPLAAVGSKEEADRAVRGALAGFRPPRGASRLAALPRWDFFGYAVGTVLLACFTAGVCVFGVSMMLDMTRPPGGDEFGLVFITILMSLMTVGATALTLVVARRAWAMRTPPWLAEDQWRLLRRTLTGLARQEPGSSRPLDVEEGLRRDLLTHPNGERTVRGLTRDGLPGPVWPDGADVARAVRRAGRTTAGLAVVLLLGLVVGGALLMIPVSMGLLSPMTLPVLAYAILGAFVCSRLKRSDAVILSRPSAVPGDHGPVTIHPDRVDVLSLPSWCEARRREDRWNSLFAVHLLLAAAVPASQAAIAIVLHDDSLVTGGGIGPAAAAVPFSVLALGGAAGAWWSASRVRRRDAERRAAAGLA